jgi:surface antigen
MKTVTLLSTIMLLCGTTACSGQSLGTAAYATSGGAYLLQQFPGFDDDKSNMEALQESLENNVWGQSEIRKTMGGRKIVLITPTSTFQRPDGIYCREYNEVIEYFNNRLDQRGTACRIDGKWVPVGVIQNERGTW